MAPKNRKKKQYHIPDAVSYTHLDVYKRQLEYSYIQLSHRLSYLEKQHSDLTEKLTDFREKETQNKQQQKLLQQNHMAQLLREELQEGVVCPVCGIPYEKHDLPTESSPF